MFLYISMIKALYILKMRFSILAKKNQTNKIYSFHIFTMIFLMSALKNMSFFLKFSFSVSKYYLAFFLYKIVAYDGHGLLISRKCVSSDSNFSRI